MRALRCRSGACGPCDVVLVVGRACAARRTRDCAGPRGGGGKCLLDAPPRLGPHAATCRGRHLRSPAPARRPLITAAMRPTSRSCCAVQPAFAQQPVVRAARRTRTCRRSTRRARTARSCACRRRRASRRRSSAAPAAASSSSASPAISTNGYQTLFMPISAAAVSAACACAGVERARCATSRRRARATARRTPRRAPRPPRRRGVEARARDRRVEVEPDVLRVVGHARP